MDGLWRFDQQAIRSIHLGLNHPFLDAIFFVISSTGLGWVQLLLILVLTVRWGAVFSGRTRANPSHYSWTWPLLVSYGATGLVNAIIKKGIPRERPSNLDWANPQETFFFNSFSSGHTATSVGIATTLWWLSRGTPYAWIGRVGLVWAALVGFSRVYRGVHWPTDVLAGAAVGVMMGGWVAWWWLNRKVKPLTSAV